MKHRKPSVNPFICVVKWEKNCSRSCSYCWISSQYLTKRLKRSISIPSVCLSESFPLIWPCKMQLLKHVPLFSKLSFDKTSDYLLKVMKRSLSWMKANAFDGAEVGDNACLYKCRFTNTIYIDNLCHAGLQVDQSRIRLWLSQARTSSRCARFAFINGLQTKALY